MDGEGSLTFRAGGDTFYGYVVNDPVDLVDPLGLNAGTIAGAELGSWFGPIGTFVGATVGTAIVWWGIPAIWDLWHNPSGNVCKSEPFDPKKWPKVKGRGKQPGYLNPEDGSVWEKDNAGHGGRKWKRWRNKRDWLKGKRRIV